MIGYFDIFLLLIEDQVAKKKRGGDYKSFRVRHGSTHPQKPKGSTTLKKQKAIYSM